MLGGRGLEHDILAAPMSPATLKATTQTATTQEATTEKATTQGTTTEEATTQETAPTRHRVFVVSFASLYPLYVKKVEGKKMASILRQPASG